MLGCPGWGTAWEATPAASRSSSLGGGGARGQRLAVEFGRHLLELVRGRSRPVEVAGCDFDLDRRFEDGRPPQLGVRGQLLRGHVHRVLEGFADGRGGRRHISLGKPHEGETGLWIPPGFLSREERLLCAVDVSFDQSDPPDLGRAATRARV